MNYDHIHSSDGGLVEALRQKVPPDFLNFVPPLAEKIFDKILTYPLKSMNNGLKMQKWYILVSPSKDILLISH